MSIISLVRGLLDTYGVKTHMCQDVLCWSVNNHAMSVWTDKHDRAVVVVDGVQQAPLPTDTAQARGSVLLAVDRLMAKIS
jgi:hypothetical protein